MRSDMQCTGCRLLARLGVAPRPIEETAMLFLESRGQVFGIHFGYQNARNEARGFMESEIAMRDGGALGTEYTESQWNRLVDAEIKAEVAKLRKPRKVERK